MILKILRFSLVFTLLLTITSLAFAQKEDHPEGKQMQQFMDSFEQKKYIDKVRQWAKDEESEYDDLKDDDGYKNDYYPGTNQGEIEKNNRLDREEMLQYSLPPDGSECHARVQVGICVSLFDIKPFYEYYIPFQKVETHNEPFTSGYYERSKMEQEMQQSDQMLYSQAAQKEPEDWKMVEQQPKEKLDKITAVKKVDQQALNKMKSKWDIKKRWKDQTAPGGGARNAEYHFMTTRFHEEYYNQAPFDEYWCHDGSLLGCLGKQEEPDYYGEFVKDMALMTRTYQHISYTYNEYKKLTPTKNKPFNCIKQHKQEGQTPQDMKVPKPQEGQQGDYCLPPNVSTTKGPFTSKVKNANYPSTAFLAAVFRGLIAAKTQSSQKDAVHPLRYEDEGLLKRDKIEILKNDRFPQGCKDFNPGKEKQFIPDWSGADFGKANHFKKADKGHWNVAAHWRFIRCCPCGYIPIPPLPLQTF